MKKLLIIAFIVLSMILLVAADEPKFFCALQSWRAFEGANNWAFQGTYICKYVYEPPADPPQFTVTQSVRLPKFFNCEGPEYCEF